MLIFQTPAFAKLVESFVATMPPGGRSQRTAAFAIAAAQVVTGAALGRGQLANALVQLAAFCAAWIEVVRDPQVAETPAAPSGEQPS